MKSYRPSARFLITAVLALGCGDDTSDADAGTGDLGGGAECTSELPVASCAGEALTVAPTPGWDPGATTTGTVTSVSSEGGIVEVSVDDTEPSIFRLPADPGLAVGDPLEVHSEALGWRLESEGRVVAFVGVVATGLAHGPWPEGESAPVATETVAGIDVSVSLGCAFWAGLVSCGTTTPDEAVGVYDVGVAGRTIAPGETQVLPLGDGSQVTVANDGVFQGLWGYRRPCEDTCLLPRPSGFRVTLVFAPGCMPPDEVEVGCEPLPADSTEAGCSGRAFGEPVPGGDEDTVWPVGCEVTFPRCLEAFPGFVASCECSDAAAPTWSCPQ